MLQFAVCVLCVSLFISAEAFDLGHNVLTSFQMPCPIFDCIFLACPSGQYKTNYVTIGGRQCPTCRTCVDNTAVAARDIVKLQMPCPIFECMYLQCPSGQYKQNYMTISGRQCPACQSCVDNTVVARASVFEMPCPIFDCLYQPCPSGHYKTNYVTINGHKCPSCQSCVDSTAVARAAISQMMPCPLYECALMVCPSGQYHTSYTVINGHKCPTCPTCADFSILALRDAKDMGVCPSTMCMTSNKCDKSDLETSYFSFHGRECAGCPTCTKTDN